MRFALLLLWLTVLAPAAHAADWLAWRRVGEATLTWGPFTVYHSQLRTPNGRYDGPQQDRALIITYRRDVRPDPLQHAQPGFATRFLLQNALCLPLVAGGVHQRLAIDVALVGDDQRPILLRAVIPTIGCAQL